jgi:hypothetical protein
MKVIAAPSFAYLLVRADGVGRVIVNARLHAKLNVTRPKPNVVALVLVGSDGAPHSYTFRVKTADLAGSLVAALEKAKFTGTRWCSRRPQLRRRHAVVKTAAPSHRRR